MHQQDEDESGAAHAVEGDDPSSRTQARRRERDHPVDSRGPSAGRTPDYHHAIPAPIDSARAIRLVLVLGAAYGLASLLLAVLVPLHATDALSYGEWSRRIGQSGGFHFPAFDGGSGFYNRPLVFVTQGWLWQLFGMHEVIARLWSAVFFAVFAAAVVRLADRGVAAALATAAALSCPDVVQQAFAGQTDMPTAAVLAVLAVVLWTGTPARWRVPAIVLLTVLAGLTKPSAFPALLGIGAATLLGPRADLRDRLLRHALPITIGTLIALVYMKVEGDRLGFTIPEFFTDAEESSANADPFDKTPRERFEVLLGFTWLGPFLVLPLAFAVSYTLARATGAAARASASAAACVALVAVWLGPLATGSPGPWESVVVGTATLALSVPIVLSRDAPAELAPSVLHCRRAVLWAAPVVAAWFVAAPAPTDTRLFSPLWPVAFALIGATLLLAAVGTAARWRPGVIAVTAVVAALALYDSRNLDSFGTRLDGSSNAWSAAASLRPGDLTHSERLRRAADPQLGAILAAVRPRMGPRTVLRTDDARMRFFFLDRVRRKPIGSCRDLRGADLALLVANGSAARLSRCPGARVLPPPAANAVLLALRSAATRGP